MKTSEDQGSPGGVDGFDGQVARSVELCGRDEPEILLTQLEWQHWDSVILSRIVPCPLGVSRCYRTKMSGVKQQQKKTTPD